MENYDNKLKLSKINDSNLSEEIESKINEDEEIDITEEKVLKYIEYLDENDKFFISFEDILKKGDEYVKYYKLDTFMEYKNKLRILLNNYSNKKKYKIQSLQNKITVQKIVKKGIVDKKIIHQLNKPKIYNIDTYLYNLKNNCNQIRLELKNEYNYLIEHKNLDITMKNNFIKKRTNFCNKLNKYYSFLYYFNKINNFKTDNKIINLTNIDYQINEKGNLNPRVGLVNINMNQDDLNVFYQNESNKLELYNKVKEMIQSNDKNYKNIIKEYLYYDKNNQKSLLKKINVKKNKNIINTLILPSNINISSEALNNSLSNNIFNNSLNNSPPNSNSLNNNSSNQNSLNFTNLLNKN